MIDLISVALTLGTRSLHDYLDHYRGLLGMLTINVDNRTRIIGRLTGKYQQSLIEAACRVLDKRYGRNLTGPWIDYKREQLYVLNVHCKYLGDNERNCFKFERHEHKMLVDYVVCYDNDGEFYFIT